ncbi:LPS export ABC transporter periplasmic protein LptC [Treponema pectinovorum]|uniref:LPS export ABC transporter periplasmic protein LptC n=1 Tax=Treponema pectinovorum TaxID=164 RepID=UPI003D8AF924
MFILKKVILLWSISFFFVACSLNYGNEKDFESIVPEFTFEDAVFKRYADNSLRMDLEVQKLEQYKSDGSAYAKNAKFKTFKEDGSHDTEGSCSLLALNITDKKYSLFDEIKINVESEELTITAQALHFDANSEQLTGGLDQIVQIKRKGTVLKGKGFSASGVSKNFKFLSDVSGIVYDTSNENSNLHSEQENSSSNLNPIKIQENSKIKGGEIN